MTNVRQIPVSREVEALAREECRRWGRNPDKTCLGWSSSANQWVRTAEWTMFVDLIHDKLRRNVPPYDFADYDS
jgi:hypothetical protein